MRLPDFTRTCRKCRRTLPLEDYHFTAGPKYLRIFDPTRCARCNGVRYHHEHERLKSLYLCNLYKLIAICYLLKQNFHKEHTRRWNTVMERLHIEAPKYFTTHGITNPTEDDWQAMPYILLLQETEDELWQIWAKHS